MVRNTLTAPHRALETVINRKMRYTNPMWVVEKDKRRSGKQAEPAIPPRKPKRKAPVKKTAPGMESKREAKPEAKPEAASLVFIKQGPVTFQVRRQDNPEAFERVAFVIKARSKDSKHEAMTLLHVEQVRDGSWLVATDGKRLHAAIITVKIKNGDYKPMVMKDTISLGEPVTGITYPNWRRVIPSDTIQKGIIDLTDSGFGKDRNQTERLSVAFNAFVRQTGELINLSYLEDLAKKKWSIHCQREKNRAITLKAEGTREEMFALIMPLTEETKAQVA